MLDITKDIQAMTTFRRNPGKFMKQPKKSKKPLVLTINGKAEAVVRMPERISACWTSPLEPMWSRESAKAWRT